MNPRHLSESNEHFTPQVIVEAARTVLGVIDLDPFSCELANSIVGAVDYFTIEEDGFAIPWWGRCFVNPPGGKDAGKSNQRRAWFTMAELLRVGLIEAAIFVCFDLGLLQTSQTATPAELKLPLDFPICYPASRLAYLTNTLPGPTPKQPDRKPTPKQIADFETTGMCIGESPPHPSCIVGVRVDPLAFLRAFRPIGKVVIPMNVDLDPRFDDDAPAPVVEAKQRQLFEEP